ncbi:MAG: XRE family transcriptional regulator [Coxiella sp. RIFCSPHIGHO2_12_FULL_42_15]|nr:MAG: XRE family transcriptional regulator [Coxiella sp. RIFCSPHIGHO2_12_FULL_42_15]
MSYFAKQVKELRIQLGFSMQELATKAEVSKSMICKIERDEVQPTLDMAGRLANALGKSLSEMLHTSYKGQVIQLTKAQQAVWEDPQGIKRRNISPVFEGLKLDWLHVEIPAGMVIKKSLGDQSTATIEKYVLVMKGHLDLTINDERYHLAEGDSLYFDAKAPHTVANPSKKVTEFYIVIKHGS